MEKIIYNLIQLQLDEKKEKIEIKDILEDTFNNISDDSSGMGLDRFCPTCKKIKTFIIDRTECLGVDLFVAKIKNLSRKIVRNLENLLHEQLVIINGLIVLGFKCPSCSEKLYCIYEYKEGGIFKLTEVPEVSKTENHILEKYKIIKSPFPYAQELMAAKKLHSKKSEIGAFIYLRRCLENYINSLLKDEDLCTKLTFSEKIKKVKDEIDENVYPGLKVLYSILSKTIHELTEDECREFFDVLFVSITTLLDNEVEKIKRKENSEKMAKELNKINSKISV